MTANDVISLAPHEQMPTPAAARSLVERHEKLVTGAIVALGALALGALAIGRMAVGQYSVSRAKPRIRGVNELWIAHVIVAELRVQRVAGRLTE